MNFKEFISNEGFILECSCSEMNSNIKESVNDALNVELDEPILTAETGIQMIRKVLLRYNIEMPAFYAMDPEGDEIVLDVSDGHYLYIIFDRNDNGIYEFYAEIADEDELAALLSDGDEEIE